MSVELIMTNIYVSNNIYDVLKSIINNVVPIDHHLNLYQCLDGKVMLTMSLRDNKHRIDLTNPYQINIVDEFAKNNPIFIHIPGDRIGEIYIEYYRSENVYKLFYRIKKDHVECAYLSFTLSCLINKFGPYISLIKSEFYPVKSSIIEFFRMLGIPSIKHQIMALCQDVIFYDGPKHTKLIIFQQRGDNVLYTAGTQAILSTSGYFVLNIAELQNTPVYEKFINTIISDPKFLRCCSVKTYKVKE